MSSSEKFCVQLNDFEANISGGQDQYFAGNSEKLEASLLDAIFDPFQVSAKYSPLAKDCGSSETTKTSSM